MFIRIREIILAIARNKALAIMVLTFSIIIAVILVNISFNRSITNEFTSKVQQTELLYKTQNLLAQLERRLVESERNRRLLGVKFRSRIGAFEDQNKQIHWLGEVLTHPDSSALQTDRQEALRGLLRERSELMNRQLSFYRQGKTVPEQLQEASQDKLMELNGFSEMARRELAQLLENNIRYLRRKIDISNQVNILLVITAILAAIYATTLTTQDFLRQKQIQGILRGLNDEKSRLFSILSHDLRSPLSSLNALIYLLKNYRKEMSDEDLDESVRQLELTSVNYGKLLEDLLTWSRLQLNKVTVLQEEVDLALLVDEISELYAEQLSKKKLWLHNQVPVGSLLVSDKGMLQVVLRNLISNAIKFTSEGGDIWINFRTERSFHLIDVKDSGVGIPEPILRTLFTNTTISMAGTHNESGTGLGLSICKDFLRKVYGNLSVESKEGKGSVFTISIPDPEMQKRLKREKRKSEPIRDFS
jgi:signal transduction histidine kinase